MTSLADSRIPAATTTDRASGLAPDWGNDVGKLLLRVTVGGLVLLHGLFKLGSGPGFIVKMLAAHNLPGALGYLVYVGEILAPVLLIAGLWTRAAAAVVVVNMVIALLLVHTGQFFQLTNQGGWALELQGLYLFGALTIMLLGAGRYAVAGAQRGLN
ncbi:putative oxidoreductase [Variovorax sp. YR216]|nr:putative oxidoreductase [Variovorax sp. YR216]